MEDVLRRLGPKTERIIRRHRINGVPQRQLVLEEGLSLSSIEKHPQKAYRAIAAVKPIAIAANDAEDPVGTHRPSRGWWAGAGVALCTLDHYGRPTAPARC